MLEPQRESLESLSVPSRSSGVLKLEQIREWIEVYRRQNDGRFPGAHSGPIRDAEGKETGETWRAMESLFTRAARGAFARGLKGCGYTSLANFIDKSFPAEREPRLEKPDLTIDGIRSWVEAYRARNSGLLPSVRSGRIIDAEGKDTGETWVRVEYLFRSAAKGYPSRGLLGCGFSSLPDFLNKTYPAERQPKPDLTLEELRSWVDAHRREHYGRFPTADSGAILDEHGSDTGETWRGLESLFRAVGKGSPARGLSRYGFSSTKQFLDAAYPTERRGPLTLERIKGWVDAFRREHGGRFPSELSGEILDENGDRTGEQWGSISSLLRTAAKGYAARGLEGCSFGSLRRFLDAMYPALRRSSLTPAQIKEWVDIYRSKHDGQFPSELSGEVTDTEGNLTGESWGAINALFKSATKGSRSRGLLSSGFTSLAVFLDRMYPDERSARRDKAELSLDDIRAWVEAYRSSHGGRFPSTLSGAVKDRDGNDTGESWQGVNAMFRNSAQGFRGRGLHGCGYSSLSDFLNKTYPIDRA